MTSKLQGTQVLPPMRGAQAHTSAAPKQADNIKPDTGALRKGRKRWAEFNAFIDRTARLLRPIDALVWLTLFRDARGRTVTVSQAYIADRLGVCRRTVSRAIGRLQAVRLVSIERSGGFRRGPNTYRLYVDSDSEGTRLSCRIGQTSPFVGDTAVSHLP